MSDATTGYDLQKVAYYIEKADPGGRNTNQLASLIRAKAVKMEAAEAWESHINRGAYNQHD